MATIDTKPFDFNTLKRHEFVDQEGVLTFRGRDFLQDLWRRTGGIINGLISNQNIIEDGTTITIKSGATFNIAGTFQLGGIEVTANANELNYNDGAIPGTVVANTTIVAGASKDIDDIVITTQINVTGNFQLSGTTVTTSADQFNTLDNIDITPVDGALLIGNSGTNKYDTATLTAGDNVTITNSAGGIEIAVNDDDLTTKIQENALLMIDMFG